MKKHFTIKSLFLVLTFLVALFVFVGCQTEKDPTLSFDKTSYEVEVGETVKLNPAIANLANGVVEYKLDKEGIVAAKEGNEFEAVAAGEVKITASLKGYDAITVEITIVVKEKAAVEYTVKFAETGETVKVKEGEKVAKPADPTKEGYEFKGWFTDEALTVAYDFDQAVVADLTLYAKWEEVKVEVEYTVTFAETGETVKVKEGEKVAKPADPTKEGYEFKGWFTDEALTVAYDFDQAVVADLTLYAKWEEVKVEATKGTIAEIVAAEVGLYEATALVVGVNAQSFLIKDETGAMLVYLGKNYAQDLKVGDKVKVTGTTSVYGKAKQFGQDAVYEKLAEETVNHGEAKELLAADCDAYAALEVIAPEYVKVVGTLAVSGNYFNLTIEGATIIGSLTYPANADELKAFDGKAIEVYGYVTGTASKDKYLNFMVTEVKEAVAYDYSKLLVATAFEGTEVEVNGVKYYVGATAFTSVNEALAKAEDGAEIYILAGTYAITDLIEVNKSVTFVGPNADKKVNDERVEEAIFTSDNYNTGSFVPGAANITFNGLGFMGIGEQGYPIQAGEVLENFTIKSCYFENVNTVLCSYGATQFKGTLTITDTLNKNSLQFLAWIDGAAELVKFEYTNNKVYGEVAKHFAGMGMISFRATDSSAEILIENNEFDFGDYVLASNPFYALSGSIVVKNNKFDGLAESQLFVSGTVEARTVEGNDFPVVVVKGTIDKIIAGEEGVYETTAVVVGVNAQSFLIKDETGAMLVYLGKNFAQDVQVGDKVKVTGKTSVYGKAKQFGQETVYEKLAEETVDHGKAKVLLAADCDAYAALETITPEYVKVVGTLAVSGNYFNLTIEDATIIGSLTYPIGAEALKALDGKAIEVTGYVTGTASKDKYLNFMVTEVVEAATINTVQVIYNLDGGMFTGGYETTAEIGDLFFNDFVTYSDGTYANESTVKEPTKSLFQNQSHPSVKTALSNPEMLAKWNWLWVYMLAHLKEYNEGQTSSYITDTYPVLEKMINGDTNAILENANARTSIRSYLHGLINSMKGCGDENPTFAAYSPDFSDPDVQKGLLQNQFDTKVELEKGTELPLPVKDGYAFGGWFNANGEEVKVAEKNVEVTAKWVETVVVESIEITNKVTELELLKTHQLEWKIGPEDAINKNVKFVSSDPKVATVDYNGLVTALGKGTVTIQIISLSSSGKTDEFELTVTVPGYFNISYETNSYVTIGNDIIINAEYIEDDKSVKVVWSSLNPEIATVDEEGKVTGVKAGNATIRATVEGKEDVYQEFIIAVVEENLSEVLQFVLDSHESNIFTRYELGIGSGTPNYYADIFGSVSKILFNHPFFIDLTYNKATNDKYGDDLESRVMESIEFITVHYTAGFNPTADAKAHGEWFSQDLSSNSTSIHYSTGNDGIYKGLDEQYRAAHAGDDGSLTTVPRFEWRDTPVEVSADDPKFPVVTITSNATFAINGKDTGIKVPEETKNKRGFVTDNKWLNDQGLAVNVKDGKYQLGTAWWCYTQVAEGRICSNGGNRNSIGIESAVNKGSDLWLTWQITARLVADIMVRYNLDITKVKGHHFFSAKDCPQPMLENDLEIWWEFIELVETEYEKLTKFNNLTIDFASNSKLVNKYGRVTGQNLHSEVVTYTIMIDDGANIQEITLSSIVEGLYAK